MRKYNVLVTATVLFIFAVIIAVMIGELVSPSSGGTWDEITETVKDVPSDTVFEPILSETETEVITPDTEVIAPKMDENADLIDDFCEKSAIGSDKNYTDEDLIYLAKIVWNEAGSDYCTDLHQQAVASVVLNRVNDPRFPDSIFGVISQGWYGECPLQYAVGGVERWNSIEPTERAIRNAMYVLENGSVYPGAIWQAEFPQGDEIVAEFAYPAIYDTVTYICR